MSEDWVTVKRTITYIVNAPRRYYNTEWTNEEIEEFETNMDIEDVLEIASNLAHNDISDVLKYNTQVKFTTQPFDPNDWT